MHNILNHFCILLNLRVGPMLIGMYSMGLEEVNLSNSDERASLLCLISECINNLEGLQW